MLKIYCPINRFLSRTTKHYLKSAFPFPFSVQSTSITSTRNAYTFTKPCVKTNPEVIVVGAGMAGMSAAMHLINHGLYKVRILEASKRTCGRVHSGILSDALCELGANVINSPYCDHVQFLNKRLSFVDNNGKNIDEAICLFVLQKLNELDNKAMKLSSQNKMSSSSLWDYFNENMEPEIRKLSENERELAKMVLNGTLSSMRYRYGTDLQNVNACSCINQYRTTDSFRITPKCRNIKSSIKYILEKEQLLLERPVQTIKYSPDKCCVKCFGGETFDADYVICTIPLGVLKVLSTYIFQPPLPEDKVKAIARLGCGQIEKLYFEYNEPVWDWFCGDIKMALKDHELGDRTKWTTGICRVVQVPASNYVLNITVAGVQAEDMVHRSIDNVGIEMTETLKRYLNNPEIPFPKKILRTNWCTDVKYLGSVSYLPVRCTMEVVQDLQQPLPATGSRLLFAGEATSPNHFGTVQGAVESGVREAKRIIFECKAM